MTHKELEQVRFKWVHTNVKYKMCLWNKWNYDVLDNIMYSRRSGRGSHDSWSDAIIMADTETSKKKHSEENHVVAFTISIRAFDMNIVTLYGHDPEEFCKCLKRIRKHIQGDHFIVYWHNMPYDWVFIRKFMFKHFGHPEKQLNIKPHYPLFINFEGGIQFRDSLILAQRSLEKWSEDLQVEHQKAVGKWDYDKKRNQHEKFNADELEYIEHDTLAGVECINKLMNALNKKLWSMPYTATGIPREEVRRRGKANGAKQLFEQIALELSSYLKMERVFHGGFTHANRHLIDELIQGLIQCYDFASSYPFVLLTRKYPMDKFKSLEENCKLEEILQGAEDTAFMFKLILYKPHLKNDFIPMPVLQISKCVKSVNVIADNGRILSSDYVEIWCNEIDAQVIASQYEWKGDICVEVEYSQKDYLPRWFTDYIFELFAEKCKLKEGDPVLYALAKARLNALYGLCVQKSIKPQIEELYAAREIDGEIKEEGEYIIDDNENNEELYQKYLDNKGNILSFAWGCWCTSYAMYNLFCLGSCVKDDPKQKISHWIYSDTDSCYSDLWDYDKIAAYNEKCKEQLRANGYGPVIVDGKEYWLGVAEHEEGKDDYSQFKTQGAKRYCGRKCSDNKLHITVAGVPKKGALCLQDDINKFTEGFIFPGSETGKLTHKYFYVPCIYTDEDGNITGDSIDLSPCGYLLDSTDVVNDWFTSLDEEINIQVYDEGRIY